MPKSSRITQKRRAELERRLNEIRRQENCIKDRIYKLEASIAAAPGRAAGWRLRMWNTLPPDDERTRRVPFEPRSRWQKRLVNRTRSRQAITALLLVSLATGFAAWLCYALKAYGVL